MKIGDKVKLEDPINGTLIGIIIDKITPSCKCKGSGEWVVDFEDHGKRSIKVKNSKFWKNKLLWKSDINFRNFRLFRI